MQLNISTKGNVKPSKEKQGQLGALLVQTSRPDNSHPENTGRHVQLNLHLPRLTQSWKSVKGTGPDNDDS